MEEGIARCKEFYDAAGDEAATRAFCGCEQAVLEAMLIDMCRA